MPLSKIRFIVASSWPGNTIHSIVAEKKKRTKILWFIFFICCIKGTKQSKQSKKKREIHRYKSLLNINFNSLELVLLLMPHVCSFFSDAMFYTRYEFIGRNSEQGKRDHTHTSIPPWNWMLPFFFLSSFFLICAVLEFCQRISKSIKLKMNFDCNGVNYKIQHLNLCDSVVIMLSLSIYSYIHRDRVSIEFIENILSSKHCIWCSKYITWTCVYPLIFNNSIDIVPCVFYNVCFLAFWFDLSSAKARVGFDWTGKIYWHSVYSVRRLLYFCMLYVVRCCCIVSAVLLGDVVSMGTRVFFVVHIHKQSHTSCIILV